MSLPNPLSASSYNHRFVETASGNRYHLVDQPPARGHGGPVQLAPTVLMCHGFPDLWYGWRYQIRDFVSRGWRVICPSQLGYGGSSQPPDLAKYSYKAVAYDMNSILDQCGAGRVVVLGHDWGGMVAWRFADFFPERVIAIASVCTPYLPPAKPGQPYLHLPNLVRSKLPNFGYQLFFAQEETGPKLNRVAPRFFAGMFNEQWKKEKKTGGIAIKEGVMQRIIEGWIDQMDKGQEMKEPKSEPEYDYYVAMFQKHGLHCPLNWYRTRRINFVQEQEANLPPFPSTIPALCLSAAKDDALPPEMANNKAVKACFPGGNLEVRVIEEADHWVLQDRRFRDDITKQLAEFVETNFAKERKRTTKL
ncbi:hypothetical protein JCM10212_003276 [Sporobolomyces blumeae]